MIYLFVSFVLLKEGHKGVANSLYIKVMTF